MRVGQAARQEQEGVVQPWLGFALEGLDQVLHRDLRCHFALEVATHAVGHHHQQCIA